MKNKISIVVPIYNKEKQLEKCLDSLHNQTYRNIEIVLVNDGSTDNSEVICKNYVNSDKRFRYYSQKNGGVSSARNLGLDNVSGDWVIFVDADDYVSIEMCQGLLDAALKENADLVISGYTNISNSKRNDVYLCKEDYIIFDKQNIEVLQKLQRMFVIGDYELNITLDGPVCKLFKRSCIKNLYFPCGIDIGEDTCFMAQVLLNISRAVWTSNIYYYRVVVSNSLSYSYDENDAYKRAKYIKWLIEFWNSKNVPYDEIAFFAVYSIATIYERYLGNYNNLSFSKKITIVEKALDGFEYKKYFVGKYIKKLNAKKRIAVLSFKIESDILYLLIRKIKKLIYRN